jgi:hypothetical protein
MNLENRFKMLWKTHPEDAKKFYEHSAQQAKQRYVELQHMASQAPNGVGVVENKEEINKK